MRAFTFTPDLAMIATLQERLASPGEVFFGLLITQEPVKPTKPDATKEDIRCKSVFRAMSEREYMGLLEALKEKTQIGQPDKGLFFVGKKANSVARGSGRVVAKKMLPIAKGFPRFFVDGSMRPLGSDPAPTPARQPQANDDLFDAWNMSADADPYQTAAEQASRVYSSEETGQISPEAYAQAAAAAQAAQAAQGGANGHQQEGGNYNHAAALQRAQQIAFQTSNQSMIHRNPGQAQGAGGDPLSARNRAHNAHKIGLDSTYASMPNGDRIASMMGHGAPGQGAPQPHQPQRGRGEQLDLDSLAEDAIGDMFR